MPVLWVQHQISGQVFDQDGRTPLTFASVSWLRTPIGTVTNDQGKFSLAHSASLGTDTLLVSFVGYQDQVLRASMGGEPLRIVMQPLALEEVVIRGENAMNTEVMHGEYISLGDLRKAACCNLSESFETNASVDVAYTDAISGSKKIQMLGLDGIYSQIMTESMPAVRGLAVRTGLSFVPGTWITSIDVNKGAGSVVNGYESMTGQINVELIKPEGKARFVNLYTNAAGRLELNAHATQEVSDRWATALLLHASALENAVDNNGDGFRDIPEGRQLNLLHRWRYQHNNLRFQIGIKALYDDRLGGENRFARHQVRHAEAPFGFRSQNTRTEVFGKLGFLSAQNDDQSLGIQFAAARHDQETYWGLRDFTATQNFVSLNAIFQTKQGYVTRLDGHRHGIRAGASFLFDDYTQELSNDRRTRQEIVPGIFAEHTLKLNSKFTAVSGLRLDAHNLHGLFLTPRLHLMYQATTNQIWRASAGRGLRYANPIPEQLSFLQNSRTILWDKDLQPEIAWNMGGSFAQRFFVGDIAPRAGQITLDYYYTRFENQIITDLDSSPDLVRFQNLDGQSYAHSLQVQAEYEVLPRLDLTAAYKYYDLRAQIAGALRAVPFTAKHRWFANLAYQTANENWKFDLTWQWIGQQRIPDTYGRLPAWSPAYSLFNGQITRRFDDRWDVYLGGENLLNYHQPTPVLDAQDPFGARFEAGLIYAPIMGRMLYAGARFSI
ncbi:MAG: TonB-dependent receptor domain-containing protein [Bernardetiaceae bacterium]